MPTVTIAINQAGLSAGTPGASRDDLKKGVEVELTAPSHPSGVSWTWTMVEKPPTSVVVPSGTGTATCRFTPDVEGGTWLFNLIVDGDKSYDDVAQLISSALEVKHSTQGGCGVKFPNGDRVPAFSETRQFGPKGWHTAMDAFLRRQARGQVSPGAKLGAVVASLPGEDLILLPGTHTMGAVSADDPDITDATAGMSLQRGSVLSVTVARTIASAMEFRGGLVKPASGILATLTGPLILRPNQFAFDPSAGGLFSIARTSIDKLSPMNFGGKLDNTADDSAAHRAWARTIQSSATSALAGIMGYLPVGRALIGSVYDTNGRGEYVAEAFTAPGLHILGCGPTASDIRFNPTGPEDDNWHICHLFEAQPADKPTINTMLEMYRYTANGDTTRRKVAMRFHDGRRTYLRKVQVETWSDASKATGKGSVAQWFSGRDAGAFYTCHFDADLPVWLTGNDVESEPLDANGQPTAWRDLSHKDFDHLSYHSCVFQADNAYGAIILIAPGVPFRQAPGLYGDFTAVHGGLVCVDRMDDVGIFDGAWVIPRRVSNGLYMGPGRFEGLDSTHRPVWIERHPLAKLRDAVFDGTLFGEGYDCRRHAFANREFTFTADNATETFTAVAHGLRTGDGAVTVSNSGGALPTGLAAATDYYPIVIDDDHYQLATSRANAFAHVALAISDNGTGTHTLKMVNQAGLTGAGWQGPRLYGVERVKLSNLARYEGTGVPIEVDADCELIIEPGVIMVPTESGRRFPEHSSHFDWIRDREGHPTFLGFDHWWNCFGDTTGPHNDLQTTGPVFNLDPSGSPLARQLLEDWFVRRYWVKFTEAANQKLRLNSADASLNAAVSSVAAAGVVLFDSTWTPGGDRALCNLAGDTNGPILRVDTTGHLYLRANGINGAPSALTFLDDQPFIYFLAHNRNFAADGVTPGTSLQCWIRKFDGNQGIISGTYFGAPGNAVDKGFGPFSSATSSFRGWQTWGAWALALKAQQNGYSVFDALGWVA